MSRCWLFVGQVTPRACKHIHTTTHYSPPPLSPFPPPTHPRTYLPPDVVVDPRDLERLEDHRRHHQRQAPQQLVQVRPPQRGGRRGAGRVAAVLQWWWGDGVG